MNENMNNWNDANGRRAGSDANDANGRRAGDNGIARIRAAFAGRKAFVPFVTGGDPCVETTGELVRALARAGAAAIEIGIPFSDPIAEGPVIQAADERALRAGCTVDKLFALVAGLRADIGTPLLLMTYYNPVFAYGVERFTAACERCGIDGLIVPDLPFEERGELLAPANGHGLALIPLIAPTSDERIEAIARGAQGFLYCVSSLGVTGVRADLGGDAERMVRRAKSVTDAPCAVGFGVSTAAQAAEVARYADGVIVGSALVRIVAEHGRDSVAPVRAHAEGIVRALRGIRA
jgi:tryptophan synthase alpha chain